MNNINIPHRIERMAVILIIIIGIVIVFAATWWLDFSTPFPTYNYVIAGSGISLYTNDKPTEQNGCVITTHPDFKICGNYRIGDYSKE